MITMVQPSNSPFNKSATDKIVVSLNESATQPGKQNMETTEMTDTFKSINTTPHLCRSKVKQTALEIAAAIRPANKFRRVGMSFVERIEAKVRAAIQRGGQDSSQQRQDAFMMRPPDALKSVASRAPARLLPAGVAFQRTR